MEPRPARTRSWKFFSPGRPIGTPNSGCSPRGRLRELSETKWQNRIRSDRISGRFAVQDAQSLGRMPKSLCIGMALRAGFGAARSSTSRRRAARPSSFPGGVPLDRFRRTFNSGGFDPFSNSFLLAAVLAGTARAPRIARRTPQPAEARLFDGETAAPDFPAACSGLTARGRYRSGSSAAVRAVGFLDLLLHQLHASCARPAQTGEQVSRRNWSCLACIPPNSRTRNNPLRFAKQFFAMAFIIRS